jgi:CTP:molybdopterin cytidylyltransferase MocA
MIRKLNSGLRQSMARKLAMVRHGDLPQLLKRHHRRTIDITALGSQFQIAPQDQPGVTFYVSLYAAAQVDQSNAKPTLQAPLDRSLPALAVLPGSCACDGQSAWSDYCREQSAAPPSCCAAPE